MVLFIWISFVLIEKKKRKEKKEKKEKRKKV